MTILGQLTMDAKVTETETVNGISYSGAPAISVVKQIKTPAYTLDKYIAETITGATTYDLFGDRATPSGTITFGTPANASTIIVTGPTGTPHTFTKVAATPTALQFVTIVQLTALIEAITGLSATDNGTAITVVVTQSGVAPNSWTITGTSSYVALSITFSGGAESDLVTTVGEDPINFGVVKLLIVKNSGGGILTVGGGANPLLAAMSPIQSGGSIVLDLSITAAAAVKNLLLTPSASLAYQLLLAGT